MAIVGLPAAALATPSTTYWAPSVATCQAFAVPHITYDTYYGNAQGASYPIDTGLTMGILKSDKIQSEIGYDLLFPGAAETTSSGTTGTATLFLLNAKLCVPENVIGKGWPAFGGGIYDLGFKSDITNYNVIYLMAQKSLPFGGYVSAGIYHGTTKALFLNDAGAPKQTGALLGWSSPDIKIGLTGLQKIDIIGDLQSGQNLLGGGGVGLDIYFNDYIALITGPVWYAQKALQPPFGDTGSRMLWTTQLDVDIPLGKKKP
jgi:hypothetical protein